MIASILTICPGTATTSASSPISTLTSVPSAGRSRYVHHTLPIGAITNEDLRARTPLASRLAGPSSAALYALNHIRCWPSDMAQWYCPSGGWEHACIGVGAHLLTLRVCNHSAHVQSRPRYHRLPQRRAVQGLRLWRLWLWLRQGVRLC